MSFMGRMATIMKGHKEVRGLSTESSAPVASKEVSAAPQIGERQEQRTERAENRRPRQYPKVDLICALEGEGGRLTLYPAEDEILVVNIWRSPNSEHMDRYGNRARKIFPQFYRQQGSRHRKGKTIANFPVVRGPSLPIGVLYGKPVDPSRLDAEYREDLELVIKAFPRGIEAFFADVIHERLAE